MNHLLCARCDAVLEHLNALLGHYQEVHGRVPKPRWWKIPECNGTEWLTAVCFYCGATKQQRAYWDETPVKPRSWRK